MTIKAGKAWQTVWLLTGILMLTACGFQLRGTVQLPASMASTYVEGDIYPDLARSLRDQLQSSNVKQVETAAQASARIRLLNESRSRRILSLDANGQASAYELIYQVRFELVGANGEVLMAEQSLTRSRDLNVSGGNPLGKSREEKQIYDALILSMATAILQRIQYNHPDTK